MGATRGSGAGESLRLFRLKQFAGVAQASEHILRREVGVLSDQLRRRPTVGETIEDELHRQPRAFDDRLADQNCWISLDPLFPTHRLPPLMSSRSAC